jgi:hypothetical protein
VVFFELLQSSSVGIALGKPTAERGDFAIANLLLFVDLDRFAFGRV